MGNVLIPVFCENNLCGTVFFSNSFHIGQGATLGMYGSRISPCPNCGSSGIVPDGEYTSTEYRLTNRRQAIFIKNIIDIIKNNIKNPDPIEKISKIKSEVPVLSKFIPKNLTEAVGFMTLLLLILQFVYQVYQDTTKNEKQIKNSEINISLDVSQVIEELLSSRQNIPSHTQQVNRQEPPPKEEKIQTYKPPTESE